MALWISISAGSITFVDLETSTVNSGWDFVIYIASPLVLLIPSCACRHERFVF